MKIAILLSGHIRTWKFCKSTFNKIYYCDKDGVYPDVFIHTYNDKNLETVMLSNSLFDACLYYTINKSKDIQKCNEALKQIGINARIVEPRETTKVKSVDGVEFEVYLDELEKIVDNAK